MTSAEQTADSPNPFRRYSQRNRLSRAVDFAAGRVVPGLPVLDFGCGNGAFIMQLSKRSISSVGYEPYMEERCRPGLPIFRQIEAVKSAGPYGLVTLFETIEHLSTEELDSFLAFCHRVLPENGGILISAPIEIGPALLIKEVSRYISGIQREGIRKARLDHSFTELARAALFGMSVKRSDNIQCCHKGFDFRRTNSIPAGEILAGKSSQLWAAANRHMVRKFAGVPMGEKILRNTRKTGAASSAPPEVLACSFLHWLRASAPFALLRFQNGCASNILTAAMQLQPDQAVFLLHSMLPTVENESQITRRVLEAVPEDKASYKPDEHSMTAFDLSWHIVSAEIGFLKGIIAGEFNAFPATKASSMSEMVELYTSSVHQIIADLKAMSGEQLAKILDFHGMFKMPAVSYLTFNNNHTIHHRGQLSAYLRPMGAKCPAIYGESYDSKQSKKEAVTA